MNFGLVKSKYETIKPLLTEQSINYISRLENDYMTSMIEQIDDNSHEVVEKRITYQNGMISMIDSVKNHPQNILDKYVNNKIRDIYLDLYNNKIENPLSVEEIRELRERLDNICKECDEIIALDNI